ncbi:DinB family protein [Lysobacter firmicutimachus]|uniref:DinB family protein n=1 Tax=Lysobacter firmicutimachus TaxID=1792846 RepID=A0ABU8CWS5_9GAMM
MSLREYAVSMAGYNRWMNQKVYQASSRLPHESLAEDRGAFFGSILGTLNHLMAADLIWLHRFASHPARFAALEPVRGMPRPTAIDRILHDRLAPLQAQRCELDRVIEAWAAGLRDEDMERVLSYANTKGVVSHRRFDGLVMHFFNHQTHHRGQVATLLTQAGEDVGVTDLLALLPTQAPE